MLENHRTVHDLCLLVQDKQPGLIFLMETKIEGRRRLESAKRRLGFVGCVGDDPIGRRGDLVLMWRNLDDMEILNFSQNHILAWVKSGKGNDRWFFTGFYGELETNRRMRTWNLIKSIRPPESVPWMVVGDFNKILFHYEKSEGRSRSEGLMSNFRHTMEFCSLSDLGFKWDLFT